MKKYILYLIIFVSSSALAQSNKMTPETLLSLKRVHPIGLSSLDYLYYSVTTPNLADGSSKTETNVVYIKDENLKEKSLSTLREVNVYQVLDNGDLLMMENDDLIIANKDGLRKSKITSKTEGKSNFKISPDGSKLAWSQDIQYSMVEANKIYDDLPEAEMYIYDDLNYRHWDKWNDGKVTHVFWAPIENGKLGDAKDVLANEPYDCPQKPFGGSEDFIWDKSGTILFYVCKKAVGLEYAESTNTDIYAYNTGTMRTMNVSKGMMGYDTNPVLSNSGDKMAWLSMSRNGYESDKNDIIVYDLQTNSKTNITGEWDGVAHSIYWASNDGMIYFLAPTQGTVQVFSVDISSKEVKQITDGPHNITQIIGMSGNNMVVGKQNMNQATEIFVYNLSNPDFVPVTFANTETYSQIKLSKIEKRTIPTYDGKNMLVWVIYPPDFDPNKKYPTLLYCQGGPQAQVSQFYSYRWNFQLMAANGYIVLAPNRRGLPGFGVEWNEEISKDWGGKAMKDYMQTTDYLSEKIPAIDKERIGAIGASYGGYSVYMLAGIHENRYKTFIAHCGLFDLKSWYGTTEELWFANWDLGGPYYRNEPESYKKFSPSDKVANWNTPMLIFQGGKDYRVPIGQGLQAFQAARVNKLKSRLIYLPNENHWVLKSQNALAWQREFYRWLLETL